MFFEFTFKEIKPQTYLRVFEINNAVSQDERKLTLCCQCSKSVKCCLERKGSVWLGIGPWREGKWREWKKGGGWKVGWHDILHKIFFRLTILMIEIPQTCGDDGFYRYRVGELKSLYGNFFRIRF